MTKDWNPPPSFPVPTRPPAPPRVCPPPSQATPSYPSPPSSRMRQARGQAFRQYRKGEAAVRTKGVPPEVTGREEATVEVVGLSIISALQTVTKMGHRRSYHPHHSYQK